MALAQEILLGDPYLNFINSLKSDSTKEGYRNALLRFMQQFHIKDTNTFSQLLPKDIESYLKNYIQFLKEENRSTQSMNIILSSVNHFCIMNDIVINYKKICKFKSPAKKHNFDRAYTHQDISKLLQICPLRLKVAVLVYSSTGIRKGALVTLQLRHLKKNEKDNLYKFTIYEGEKEQYYTFCTPETASLIDEYLDYRARCGEKLTDDSYLIREEFDINDLEQIKKRSRTISSNTIGNTLLVYLLKTGLRDLNRQSQFTRKPIPLLHGFRKFFTTQLINSKINPEIREMLLGHKIGLASCYYRPSEEEMLAEYMKAINNLTINEENRLKMKIEKLEVERSQFETLASKIEAIEKKIK
jgi:integrase